MASRYDRDWRAFELTRQDVPFYCSLVAETEGTIVEVGAGTGRIALPVAQAAAPRRMVAVEPSPGMRDSFAVRLDKTPCPNVTVVDGHFASIPVEDGGAGYVFSGFRAFQHLVTIEQQLEGLAELRRVLRPGGTLALDFFEPDPDLLNDTDWELMVSNTDSHGVTRERYDRREHDRNAQLVTVHMRWEVSHEDVTTTSAESSYAVRYLFRYELQHLLARAGFEAFDLYGEFDRSPVDERIRELIIIATR